MREYEHILIEQKWQKIWDENKTFKTDAYSEKPKFYALDMFPYPSGAGLHVGHPEGYTATDILSRMKRMQGFEVMHPIGFDAFGLPAEQYAIQTNNHPEGFTKTNIDTFRKQIKALGFSYDWDREIATTDEKYYKWTQWIFSKLYENGLAELKNMPVNYCPECGTVLANEEVIDGKCERKGHEVIKKDMHQWVLKITKYADRLLEDLDTLDWPHSLKEMQRNWIGKSQGAEIDFKIEGSEELLTVYTTRPDTIFGVTSIAIACENELVQKLVSNAQKEAVERFVKNTVNKSDLDRTEKNKDKSGVFLGAYAIHPITNQKVEIWVADYVLNSYATGAVMAVSAHDERDFEFAQKYNIELIQVVEGDLANGAIITDGVHINSDFINGMKNDEAKAAVIKYLEDNKVGRSKVSYKLRDWLFSRQRYWGEPFPILHLEDGSIVLDENLPVTLPNLDNFTPGSDGQSPLSNATSWLEVDYKGQKAIRETNTMPQWAGSCWYYLRYLDPTNEEVLADPVLLEKWLPVDLYIGGAEHAVLHLLYARFWHKFLYDIGVVKTKEPFQKLYNQGMILGENNEKMSKSKGNVVNPDDIVASHGADTLRLYEMFMGPLDASIAWSEDGLDGARKFLSKVFRLYQSVEIKPTADLDKVYHQTIKKVTEDYEKLSFNTAISAMMIFINDATKLGSMSSDQATGFLKLLNPIAPHMTEELYSAFESDSITYASWPIFDATKLIESEVEMVVQIKGKVKAKIVVALDSDEAHVKELALASVTKLLEDTKILKVIIVKNKIVNIVI